MSEKAAPAAEKKPAPADEKKPAPAGKGDGHGGGKGGAAGLLAKTPIVVAGVMLVEAVILFAGFKFLGGGPRNAAAGVDMVEGAGGHDATTRPATAEQAATAELPIVDIRAPNKQSGRTFLYDVSIFAVVKAENQDKVKSLISSRDALIKDKVRTIIAEMDPDKLGGGSEPGLETLRRQVKFQLDQILGDGLVSEVLVPRCMPFRTDY
jgi:flagellar basal body-associated protein FliL